MKAKSHLYQLQAFHFNQCIQMMVLEIHNQDIFQVQINIQRLGHYECFLQEEFDGHLEILSKLH